MADPSEVMSSLGFAGDDWDLVFFGDGLAAEFLLYASGVRVGVAPCADSGALFCGTGAVHAI